MTLQSEIYCLVVVAMTGPLPCCQDVQDKRIVLESLEVSMPRASKVVNSDASGAE